jgi:hypothetical protein
MTRSAPDHDPEQPHEESCGQQNNQEVTRTWKESEHRRIIAAHEKPRRGWRPEEWRESEVVALHLVRRQIVRPRNDCRHGEPRHGLGCEYIGFGKRFLHALEVSLADVRWQGNESNRLIAQQ